MFEKWKEFFFGPAKKPQAEAPYKIETPPTVDAKASTQTKCGCGRSQTGFCVGLHALKPEEWAVHPDNPAKPKKTAVKKPAAKKPKAEKPVVLKKPRAPRKPTAKK